ncbi:MAG: hypothetical protein V1908_02175 [Candidatus Peregrinibacteria bacterium]
MTKKVLYIEIDEAVASIHERVSRLSQVTLYLVVPRKAVLFQSLVNLKFLKAKLEEQGKTMILVTTDPTGKHLAEKLQISVAPRVEVEKIDTASPEPTPEMKIQPIQARRNEVIRDQPKRFTEKKMTISEFIQEFRKKRKSGKTEASASMLSLKPHRKFLSLILILSFGLFLLIGYIALPGATLYLRPSFDNLDHTVNIVLADKHANQNLLGQNKPHVIASEKVTTVTKQTKIFSTTSQEFYGEAARGSLTIVNTLPETWDLKSGTRFQTKDDLVFRLRDGVTVPAASVQESKEPIPGRLQAIVIADPFDAYGKPVGGRGNIGSTRFFLPGLSKLNQGRLWGESQAPMTGGTTAYRKIVKSEDIEAAKKQIRDNLTEMAREELHQYLETQNELNHTNLVLLDDRRYLKTELLDLRLSEDLEGSAREKFEVFAKIQAQGVAYDADQLYAILAKEIRGRVHPDMQLRDESIRPDSLQYEVIDEDPLTGLIKMTATIKGIEEYIVDPESEAGQRLGEKIKAKILGLPVDEAQSILENFPEIDAVNIRTWPFWLDIMPRLPENIRIKRLTASN